MFSVNDTVMYGSSGVCKIVDITSRKTSNGLVDYYVLKPVYDANSTIYYPVDGNAISIRKLLSLEEVSELISSMPDTDFEWIDNEQERKEKYSQILKDGDHRELIMLIKSLYHHREQVEKSGKKFHSSDEKAMKEAESKMYGEFAHVLSIKPAEVLDYIMSQLELPDDKSEV